MIHLTNNKTEAIRQARKAVTIHRQGSGWIVSAWDEDVGCNRTSGEMTHSEARQSAADGRLVAAIRALGGDPIDADVFGGRGTLEARLHAWCEENP